jgi:hypothetical protein
MKSLDLGLAQSILSKEYILFNLDPLYIFVILEMTKVLSGISPTKSTSFF